jgi:hypothetical protein
MKIQILVATHKVYEMPADPVYLPVETGRAYLPALGYTGDDTGENISEKKPAFCELSALYWGWKNLDADCLGLCHYRRYFVSRRGGSKRERILTGAEWEALLEETPVVVPKKRHYWIETNFSQYVHAHHQVDLETTRNILSEKYPEYLPAYDRVMARRSGHRFNMLAMRRDLLDAYCGWLFDVLLTLDERLDVSAYSENDRRACGFVGERLLDVWLETNGVPYREVPVANLERQHWPRKIAGFLKRKFVGTAH